VVILQTINDGLPSRVNLSQFVPEKPHFMGDTPDGSSVNVFKEIVSISKEDLVSIAALLNAPVPTYSECNSDLACCSVDDICEEKRVLFSMPSGGPTFHTGHVYVHATVPEIIIS
jgi:hypothetical protein